MKIGIIVHSKSGNTYSVIEGIQEKLVQRGHDVKIERIQTEGEKNLNEVDPTKIHLGTIPDVSQYDGVILAAPVRAFSISPILGAYLTHISSLENKKVACLVTQFLPFPQMGGKRAINQIKQACKSKGAIIAGTAIVNWTHPKREAKIVSAIEIISKLFG
jgi:menaquinone-dependent protoporphyrinogen IX oxidase